MRFTTGKSKKVGAVSTLALAAATLIIPIATAQSASADIGSACRSKIKTANSHNEYALKADARGNTRDAAAANGRTKSSINAALTTCRTSHNPRAVKVYLDSAKQYATRAQRDNQDGEGRAARQAELHVKQDLRQALASA